MMRSMRGAFRVDMGEARDDWNAPRGAVGRVAAELARYGHGPERPQDARGTPPIEARSWLSPQEQAMTEYQDQVSLLNAPTTWHRVDVRVTQNPEGAVSAAWVIASSGSRTLDDAALRAVRDGASRAPPPPEGVVGDRDAIQSDWAFEAGDVATYMNQAGCVEDPVQGWQCAALGRGGIVRTRLRLLRVHDARTPSLAERRAERHRDTRRIRP